MATGPEKDIMSEEKLMRFAKSCRLSLIRWLTGTFIVMTITFGVKEWSYTMPGWEAEVVYVVFYLVFAISGLCVLAFSALLCGWFKELKLAIRDRETFDEMKLLAIYSSVFGPIPWR